MQEYIEKLHVLKIFELKDVMALTGKMRSAQELLRNYKKKVLVVQVRRNLYAVTDLATKIILATKFEIGSHISPTSYISYHSALDYHGVAHQQFFTMYISSENRFNSFEFEGIQYNYCKSNITEGVETPPMNSKVKVTDLERTVIDCLDRIDRAGGLEELMHCLAMINYLNEDKLINYLDVYNKAFLYKKAGFVLSKFQQGLKLSENFISFCHRKGAPHVKYLSDGLESNIFHKTWNIYAPKNILSFLEQGSNELV
jgi:predicted transcriptional regulator of viral defense system